MSAFFNGGFNPLNSMLNVGRPKSPFQGLSNSPGILPGDSQQKLPTRPGGSVGPFTTNPSTPYKRKPKWQDYYDGADGRNMPAEAKQRFTEDLQSWDKTLRESGRSYFDTPDYQEWVAPIVAQNREMLAKRGQGYLSGYDKQLEEQRQRRAKDTWLYPINSNNTQ
jgi:hypothetical protein